MAGLPWIKVWTVVGQHPKVQRLEGELGIKDALGVVVRLWCWTADYCPDGEIPTDHAESAARAARGDATRRPVGSVIDALSGCGFLDRTPTGFRVHDWHDMQTTHVERVEKQREQARERQARHRAARNAPVTRDVTRDGHAAVTGSNAGDKSREEESRELPFAAPAADPSPAPASPPRKLSAQGEAFNYWRDQVWWRISTAPCPAPTDAEMAQLSARIRSHGGDGVRAAMDEAVRRMEAGGKDGEWLRANLTLLGFATTQFAKFLPRAAGATVIEKRTWVR